jgi:hypothetical protein
MMVGLGVAPYMGIGVRLLTSNLIVILAFGLILWIVGTGIFWYVFRRREISKEQIFVWTLQFITFYVVSVLVTGALTKH